jgi:hypothetical protein
MSASSTKVVSQARAYCALGRGANIHSKWFWKLSHAAPPRRMIQAARVCYFAVDQ